MLPPMLPNKQHNKQDFVLPRFYPDPAILSISQIYLFAVLVNQSTESIDTFALIGFHIHHEQNTEYLTFVIWWFNHQLLLQFGL